MKPVVLKTSIMALKDSLGGLNYRLDTAEGRVLNWKIALKKSPR